MVYVEYVLIDNFIIDYLLLKGTFLITTTKTTKLRLILCSALGSLFALIYPLLVKLNSIIVVVKILFGCFMVLICAKEQTPKQYFASVIVFFCFTFLMGGIILGVGNLLNINFANEYCVALVFLPAYFIFKGIIGLVKYFYVQKDITSVNYQIELYLGEICVVSHGFLDTGNLVYDELSPVIICDKKFAKKFFASGNKLPKIKNITIQTVNGISQKPSFKLDKVVIYNKNKKNIFNNITMCVVEHRLNSGVILHPSLLEVDYATKVG